MDFGGGGIDNEFAEFYKQHSVDFQKVYDMLEDDFSRKTYESVIAYRKTYNIKAINKVIVSPQYFLKKILPPSDAAEIFVDGGAYIGDTGMEFLKYYKENSDYKMYFWECDKENINMIHKNFKKKKVNYEIIPYAMWEKKEELRFSASGSSASLVAETGNIIVKADSIDNIHKGQKITFIKMDIEGSEMNALKGAEKIIKEEKPKLAICIYHQYNHLYEIPLMIKQMVPEYKIYIRHHSDTIAETVVYAAL